MNFSENAVKSPCTFNFSNAYEQVSNAHSTPPPQIPSEIQLHMPDVFIPETNNASVFKPTVTPEEDINHPGAQNQQNTETEKLLYNQYEEKVRPCIDLIDSLRALGVEEDLGLPAIAVIGDQSSGKSSVLEALSGIALPRGSGIVTRCPLALRLKKLPSDHKWKGKISYLEKIIALDDPSGVEKEIRKAQNLIAGEGVGISHHLINLEISSPDVPDLTLIDLPGITRVAVGNQPRDIGDQIKKLIKTYIDKQETINLVVVPCNVDIATTEVLKMAQEVDPEGERTLGILTKPDLVDKGTEVSVMNVLRNTVIPLKKGYMIVKCRGQQDIESDMCLTLAIQKERAFFENHKYFSNLLTEKKATCPLLAVKLTNELVEHICKTLPILEEQINVQLQKTNDEMSRYGKGMPKTEGERLYFLTDKIQLFNADITNSIQGEEKLSENNTRLFTKIRKQFQRWSQIIAGCNKEIEKSLAFEKWKFESQYRGRELPGFVNFKTFENIIRKHITALERPAMDILIKITEIVRQHFTEVAKEHFDDFPNLFLEAKNRIDSINVKQAEIAEATVRIQFAMEQNLYCQDSIYVQSLNAIKEEQMKADEQFNKEQEERAFLMPVENTTVEENTFVKEIAYHLKTYFSNAGSRLSCQIPLIIQYYILKKHGDSLQTEMFQLLQNREKILVILQERKDNAERRQLLTDRIHRLAEARRYLQVFQFKGGDGL